MVSSWIRKEHLVLANGGGGDITLKNSFAVWCND